MPIKSPVVFFAFNRPFHTEKAFSVLRKIRPECLFIVADGPRQNHLDDIPRCQEVRKIIENVDWPCDVRRNYADSNMGLKRRVSSGIDWVFEQVDSAIILEDDCIAHPDFFSFCDVLLERYADDTRVSVITGNNFQNGTRRGSASYYFSKYCHCWGWATWKRAWRNYDGDISFWPEWSNTEEWIKINPDSVERHYWKRIFNMVSKGQIDSWAYPWTASVWHSGGLSIMPNVNLVSNIGFGKDATHTKKDSAQSELPAESIGSYLVHPETVSQDVVADRYDFDHTFGGLTQRFPRVFLYIPRRILSSIYRNLVKGRGRVVK